MTISMIWSFDGSSEELLSVAFFISTHPNADNVVDGQTHCHIAVAPYSYVLAIIVICHREIPKKWLTTKLSRVPTGAGQVGLSALLSREPRQQQRNSALAPKLR